jgi:hypothetical protein
MSRFGNIGGRLYRGEVSVDSVGRKRTWYSISAAIPRRAYNLSGGRRSGVSSGNVGASAPPSISMILPVM